MDIHREPTALAPLLEERPAARGAPAVWRPRRLALFLGAVVSIWGAARASDAEWLNGPPDVAAVERVYGGTDVSSYARSAAAFAVLVDFIEVRAGVDQKLIGAELSARLPPEARPLWRRYVGKGYSKTLTGAAWQLFTTPAFRSEVLLRFVSPASFAAYETARNGIPGVAGPSRPLAAPVNTVVSPPATDEVSIPQAEGSPDTALPAEAPAAKAGAVDKYGGHLGSDGFYYDRFGGHYNQWGYEYKDGSYKSCVGNRYDAKSNKVFDQKGAEIHLPADLSSPKDRKGFVVVECMLAKKEAEAVQKAKGEKEAAKAKRARSRDRSD